jgi:hypothetical protein
MARRQTLRMGRAEAHAKSRPFRRRRPQAIPVCPPRKKTTLLKGTMTGTGYTSFTTFFSFYRSQLIPRRARLVSLRSPPAQGFAPAASPHTPGGCLQILAKAGAANNGPTARNLDSLVLRLGKKQIAKKSMVVPGIELCTTRSQGRRSTV